MTNQRLALFLIGMAAALLLLPACQTDTTFNLSLSGERKEIDSLLVDQAPAADVEVSVNQHGRHVEVTLPGVPDSLARMDWSAPPDTAKIIATDVARTLKRSYKAFDQIQTLEVGFTNDAAFWTSTFTFDKEALQRLEP